MRSVSIRPALPSDAAAIAAIYSHYVVTSTATFDTEPVTAEQRAAWLAERGPEHPVLVASSGGEVVAWGSLSPYAPRPAWGATVEVGVYVDSAHVGTGIGSSMLAALVEEARAAGHHAIISRIVSENAASIAMAEKAGFERVGHLREVGRKFDRWLDVIVMEYLIAEAEE
jgi:phosphinothricin acetyltransferase